jgi:hypothetical protein
MEQPGSEGLAKTAAQEDPRPPSTDPTGRSQLRWSMRVWPSALVWVLGGLVWVLAIAVSAPAAQASFGVSEANFEAGTCVSRECTYASPPGDFFTQAAGHPSWGITSFELNTKGGPLGSEPEGALERVRVDVPPGLAADPQALGEKCPIPTFEAGACPAGSKVGETEMEVFDGLNDLTITGNVYDLDQPPGLPLDFGIDVAPAEPLVNPVHLFLEGHVYWEGDYHEYFEIQHIPREADAAGGLKVQLSVLKSKLLFDGQAGGNFLTLPSVCSTSTTSHLEVRSYEGAVSRTETHTPVGVEGCGNVPFMPTVALSPETSASDTPDGATAVVQVPQHTGAGEINSSDVKDVHVTLSEGMTLDPSAAHGLEPCKGFPCPSSATKLGSVTIETDLPARSLTGSVYLGDPGGGAITGPPYTIYLETSSIYGVTVRLTGTVNPNPSTGRLEVSFDNNPQLPFSELILTMNGGPRAPLANPVTCGSTSVESVFTPYTGGASALTSTPFASSGCPSPAFSLSQSTQESSAAAGAYTSYTFNLTRSDGQQYLSQLYTVLPAGLVGAIPSVTLCGEPQASEGECPSASQIGSANVSAGAGSEPYSFSGPVYMTGPYDGAPYGLSIPIEAVAGPFDLGRVTTRATIGVDPNSGRVIATSSLPTIVGGVPLRVKTLSVTVNRSDFLFNPTNCQALATNSLLTSTLSATQNASSPFQVGDCGALSFKPALSASSSAKTSKVNGASLQVKLTQGAHEANIHSVVASLPTQLPSRLTTLQKACPEATFTANPLACPPLSKVGAVTVTTPVLAGVLSGPAYLVSHGGAAFPNLDLILDDGGVRVILVGNTTIKAGVTTESFASIPDVPVSTFVLTLPLGPDSVLAANGSLCAQPLAMPTVITAQNGAQVKQDTAISVIGCGVRILRRRLVHDTLLLTIQTIAAGRVRAGGNDLRSVSATIRKPATMTLKVPVGPRGQAALGRHRKLELHVRVSFAPAGKGQASSSASTAFTVKR